MNKSPSAINPLLNGNKYDFIQSMKVIA